MSDLLRVYLDPAEIGQDGYPFAWHKPPERYAAIGDYGYEVVPLGDLSIKNFIRERDGHRCLRCGHPYRKGEHGNGEWSPCDDGCTHSGPGRWRFKTALDRAWMYWLGGESPPWASPSALDVEAQWRILTVHHLNGIKHDCRWWNLVSLCQRCHLSVQSRVVMEREYDRAHSEWFRPFVAAFYAWQYLGEEISREEADARREELLALGLRQASLFP